MSFLNFLSDREKAIIIWFCILLIWVLAYKSVRNTVKAPLVTILKILCSAKIGIPLLLMAGYVSLLVFFAYRVNLWDVSMLKDTLVWFFGSACIMFGSTAKAGEDSAYFKEVIIDSVKFSVFVEFLVNLYVFNIFVELVLVPILFLVAAMLVIPGNGISYTRAKQVLTGALVLVGLAMLGYALVHALTDFTHFATIVNAKSFLQPLILTIAFLPFMYFLTLWARYETLFTRITIFTRNKELASFIMRLMFWKCLLNLNKLNNVFKQCSVDLMAAEDKQEVKAVLRHFKNKPVAKSVEM